MFDLKGSIINRYVEEKDITKGSTLKDVNLINLKKKEIFCRFQRKDVARVMN